jgi:hypothetical protein
MKRTSETQRVGQSSSTTPRVVRQKTVVMNPVGSGTRNDCGGKSQRQFT